MKITAFGRSTDQNTVRHEDKNITLEWKEKFDEAEIPPTDKKEDKVEFRQRTKNGDKLF